MEEKRKLNEEAFELLEAITKAEVNRSIGISRKPSELAIEHIAEEIADVMVMLEQFKLYYGISGEEITKIFWSKVDRQLGRMENENSK